jgi:hypothetical protein
MESTAHRVLYICNRRRKVDQATEAGSKAGQECGGRGPDPLVPYLTGFGTRAETDGRDADLAFGWDRSFRTTKDLGSPGGIENPALIVPKLVAL